MKTVRVRFSAVGAAVLALTVSSARANDLPIIPGVKTKLSVKAIPVVPPLTAVDGNSTFFGLTLPRQTPPPCAGKGLAKAKIVAASGTVTATIKVSDKLNPSATVNQQVSIQGRLHDDGCNSSWIIPQLTFAGPSQGLPA